MGTREARKLLDRYNVGDCTEQERMLVEQTLLDFNEPNDQISKKMMAQMKVKIFKALPAYLAARVRRLVYVSVAAAVLMILIGPWLHSIFFQVSAVVSSASKIEPGSNKAILILAGGQTINLAAAKEGNLALQEGVQISKTSDGKVVSHDGNHEATSSELATNTIQTPKGGTYQLVLTDGTKVWLNAATRLSFPSTFSSRDSRNVELNGEAYFEVAKDAKHPFIVITSEQTIKVTGTHFNVQAYGDTQLTRTTLLEGSVKVGDMVINPGQQAAGSVGDLTVSSVDTDQAVAWQKGEFMFSEKPLSEIMLDISRWYDVEVKFIDSELSLITFGGTISRYSKLSRVLELLELTGEVKFKVQGRRVEVRR